MIRDNNGVIDEQIISNIIKHLGGVLWYTAEMCTALGIKMNDVMEENILILLAAQVDQKFNKG